ncbi:hypothetical protein J2W22_000618 [Sphingomonas kyeonggiensis]|uniref:hypothetical protein n=1 Tax=Sphingomonas kyeonggiensis TaxID=1268553 RepID=UPI00277D9555|nr:hypothetical protein [Sphingomonas kyeonggiensis]MDQ0248571.1 hypothetical protein [Sphingomonas kyeonggiensis]
MRPLLILIALFFTVPALAADLAGSWAVRSHGRVVMLLTLAPSPGGWSGTLTYPAHFAIDAQLTTFTELSGARTQAIHGVTAAEGASLNFTLGAGKNADRLRFRLLSDGTARLRWQPFEADFVLDRAEPGETLIRFDPEAQYPLDRHWKTNAEMTALFEADQKAREDWDHADHAQVERDDRVRRARTRALLETGALESGADYYHAAFLLQHGAVPDDYLLAHALAMAAQARGYPAGWIAAATLDRYLQASGKAQIFGTQYRHEAGTTTQQPFAPGLIPDTLREALNLPAITPAGTP